VYFKVRGYDRKNKTTICAKIKKIGSQITNAKSTGGKNEN